eukprot:TRINITY_DN7307_c0_g1_i7.p1 TRINITY_DN7307_c0_g1~~TRINITY_DN7307_c0_g1_i7.p1  ORF type:complete len:229 (+),score=-21.51 TRINITY_DN7307_c0_g1_i7:98-784(+)
MFHHQNRYSLSVPSTTFPLLVILVIIPPPYLPLNIPKNPSQIYSLAQKQNQPNFKRLGKRLYSAPPQMRATKPKSLYLVLQTYIVQTFKCQISNTFVNKRLILHYNLRPYFSLYMLRLKEDITLYYYNEFWIPENTYPTCINLLASNDLVNNMQSSQKIKQVHQPQGFRIYLIPYIKVESIGTSISILHSTQYIFLKSLKNTHLVKLLLTYQHFHLTQVQNVTILLVV